MNKILKHKEWTGNNKSIYTCLGSSNHTDKNRAEYDYYATEPKATQILCDYERFDENVWECACGELHMANVLKQNGYNVRTSDIIDRTNGNVEVVDFLNYDKQWDGDIITNPPYSMAQSFVEKALSIIPDGNKVAMFLKLTFLESKARKEMFKHCPLKILYVSSSRLQCAKNGDFDTYKKGANTAVAYGWYIFEKGYKKEPIIKWVN